MDYSTSKHKNLSKSKSSNSKIKRLLREIRTTDRIQKQVERANARDLETFHLFLGMENVDTP